MTNEYDIIVVGAGHAGCEAALVAAKTGMRVLLLTMNLDTVGLMSCNPAIGGLAKGVLVREVDALGGEMGRAIDATGIQFRMLNTSKGPAVQALRAQADKQMYRLRMKRAVENQPGLFLKQGRVKQIVLDNGRVAGVNTGVGEEFVGRAVILTTGTFTRGLLHFGDQKIEGGRAGEGASHGITEQLKTLGFRIGRMKTGTPPRLDGKTIDYKLLTEQKGDDPPVPFSFRTDSITQPQISCHITFTNEKVHRLIRQNIGRAPMFNGQIEGTGVRYCPSIEDKVMRFPEKEAHQLFLEPEGRETLEVYVNGLSTSLPADVQVSILREIEGLKSAEIMRLGYAVEYDYVDPMELDSSLMTKRIPGLFHAGQINGTTGYEEAAAQGIMAGINAVELLRGKDPVIFGREEAYIGVLIDDLVTKGVSEPYRMFTSRAEHRLNLRHDNSDIRLMEVGYNFGSVDSDTFGKFVRKRDLSTRAIQYIEETKIHPNVEMVEVVENAGSSPPRKSVSLGDLLRRPEVGPELIARVDDLRGGRFRSLWEKLDDHARRYVLAEVTYKEYFEREARQVAAILAADRVRIPSDFSFQDVNHISAEVRQRLEEVRPRTLGQAGRISGVTPAAITMLEVYLRRHGGPGNSQIGAGK